MKKYLTSLIALMLTLGMPLSAFATSVRSAATNSSTTGTDMTVSLPAGTVAGDVVIVTIHGNNQTTTADNNGATPFTKDLNDWEPNPTSGHVMAIYSRRATGAEAGTLHFTLGTTGRWAIVAVTIQSPNASTIYDVAPNTSNGTNADSPGSNNFNTASITTLTDNAIDFVAAGSDDSIGSITGTPAGYASQGTPTNQPLGVATKTITPAGSTGTQNFTTGTTAGYITMNWSVAAAATAINPPLTIASKTTFIGKTTIQ